MTLNIVFAGTPAFTCPALDALAASRHHLSAIYTQPDRPAGRGRRMQASPAKQWAEAHDIPVYQPLNFKNQAAQDELRALNPDILVVIAYGLILPQAVLDIPRLGCINVHASLLPHWRGASPIQASLLNGDAETGVTIMQLDAGMDTGPMLARATCKIPANATANSLHDSLAQLAAEPLLDTLDALAEKRAQPMAQNHELATYAPKITKQDAVIAWHKPAIQIERQIRAYNPWPIARTEAGEQTLRIHQARALAQTTDAEPGTVLSLDATGMQVATGENILCVEIIQFAGGKALSIADWLNARKQTLYPGLKLQ
ncbi:MAG: methionyl-tRNA formyltransferase [Legionellaceae bacterium]|jgi:methionyl-tRNA formyltransferase|nr:methionyl-tRNA formyltransferase [Legionellaceae bacterium]